MTRRTGWKCEACLCYGAIEHDEHAGVSEVINLLSDAHAAASPNCGHFGSIRVWMIPSSSGAPAARETQETNDDE